MSQNLPKIQEIFPTLNFQKVIQRYQKKVSFNFSRNRRSFSDSILTVQAIYIEKNVKVWLTLPYQIGILLKVVFRISKAADILEMIV